MIAATVGKVARAAFVAGAAGFDAVVVAVGEQYVLVEVYN